MTRALKVHGVIAYLPDGTADRTMCGRQAIRLVPVDGPPHVVAQWALTVIGAKTAAGRAKVTCGNCIRRRRFR